MQPTVPSRRAGFALWLATAAVLIAAGIFVPYTVLAGSALVFAFWSVFGLSIILLILWAVSGWRDRP
ncbi:hypothetical protein [Roseicitreum antarcticum]|uniref:Uncharacterized protein n=1 Tax=Roseicitreum antarcticum TaxID=564137 RepID=A0A1H2VYC2_9RHOB|nr:hypothetical protein [Roseicitreum antarcticum]SDW73340.1 hypothetical protein SAMN04488238_103212 [Roseicitreum antarcticum]